MSRKIIDLSYPLHEGMTTYPVHWHPVVEITQLGRHGIENRETRKIVLGTHIGTHIDAPRHFIPGGKTVESIPLDLLVGTARVVRLRGCSIKQELQIDDLRKVLGREKPKRLILDLGWSKHWGTMNFYTDHAFLSNDCAQWLVDRGVRLLGMDTPQMDSPDHGRNSGNDSPVHKIMLGQGVIFLEYMNNLAKVRTDHVELYVLPLNILGADGAPCRCIAFELPSTTRKGSS